MGGLGSSKRSPLLDVILVALFVLALLCACEFARAQTPLPDARSVRAENRAYLIFTGVDFAATFADAAVSTNSHFRRGVGTCVEMDPLFGSKTPSAARVWGQMTATTAGLSVVSYLLKRGHHKWFVLIPTADTLLHGASAASTAGRCF